MNRTRLVVLVLICTPLAATGCIERLPPRPPPEVPPYPQERFDSPLNAWHHYLRAAELLNEQVRSPQYQRGPLTAEQVDQFAEYLKHQQPALAALDRAVAAPYCVVPRFDPDAFVGMSWRQMRELARLQTMRGRVLMHQGDTAGAVSAWLGTVELGHDMMQEGPLIARLVGIAIDSIGLRPTIDLVKRGEGTAEDYRAIVRRVSAIEAHRFPYPATLGREFAAVRHRHRDAFDDPAKMMEWLEKVEAGWDLEGVGQRLKGLGERLTVLTQGDAIRNNYDTCWSLIIEDAQRPYPQRDPDLENLWSRDPINRRLFEVHPKARLRDLSDVAGLRALVTMAALQWYREDHGQLPPTLDALRPAYLDRLPIDPFSERPLGYLRLPDDTFVVYSAGPDGDDDRAEVEFEWRRGAESDGDIVFREEEGKE